MHSLETLNLFLTLQQEHRQKMGRLIQFEEIDSLCFYPKCS